MGDIELPKQASKFVKILRCHVNANIGLLRRVDGSFMNNKESVELIFPFPCFHVDVLQKGRVLVKSTFSNFFCHESHKPDQEAWNA